jgi:hypothetical protein
MHFRYLKDPLLLVCVALYFMNRWVLKPYLPNEFSSSWLNDLICLPFWVPIMLFILRRIGLRRDDGPPKAGELLVPLRVWSWSFEVYLPSVPFFKGLATADHQDILAYTAGGCIGAVVWKLYYREWWPARAATRTLSGT